MTRPTWSLFTAVTLLLAIAPGTAQPPLRPEEFTPEKAADFVENFLLKETPEQREQLEQVPVSPREELQYGNRAAEALISDLRSKGIAVLSRGRDVDYVRRLIQIIQPQMRNRDRYRSLRVFVADCNGTDAMSFPGGTLVVSKGLLELCDSEAALVAVLGHELSHLDHGHQLQLVRRMKLAQQSFSGRANSWEPMMQSGIALMKACMRPFRPEDEAQADTDGATWAYHAGYDPREMADLFVRLAQRKLDPGSPLPSFFRSHPASIDRASAVREHYARLQADSPAITLYVGRQNLRRRVPRSEQEFAD